MAIHHNSQKPMIAVAGYLRSSANHINHLNLTKLIILYLLYKLSSESNHSATIYYTGDKNVKKRFWQEKYPLPYWCTYIAWLLAVLTILISCWFVVFYSLQWGKEKSEQWLSSLLLSTLQSLVLIQPVKVSWPLSSLKQSHF